MRPALRLGQYVTFFTRPQCGLCMEAKHSVLAAQKSVSFGYKEVDITEPGNKKWHDLYAFDVPVAHLAASETSSKHIKLMHRFTSDEIVNALANVKDQESN